MTLVFVLLQIYLTAERKEMFAMPTMCLAVCNPVTQQTVKMDSHEEHSGTTHQGSREPRLLPAQNAIPSQDNLTPALQLLLQLGCFLCLNTKLFIWHQTNWLQQLITNQSAHQTLKKHYSISTIWKWKGKSFQKSSTGVSPGPCNLNVNFVSIPLPYQFPITLIILNTCIHLTPLKKLLIYLLVLLQAWLIFKNHSHVSQNNWII